MRTVIVAAVLALPLAAHPASGQGAFRGAWHAMAATSRWNNGPLLDGFSQTIDLRVGAKPLVYHSTNDADRHAVGGLSFTAPRGPSNRAVLLAADHAEQVAAGLRRLRMRWQAGAGRCGDQASRRR
jgi:hypothetical protein